MNYILPDCTNPRGESACANCNYETAYLLSALKNIVTDEYNWLGGLSWAEIAEICNHLLAPAEYEALVSLDENRQAP
jgi:hypothetical protein